MSEEKGTVALESMYEFGKRADREKAERIKNRVWGRWYITKDRKRFGLKASKNRRALSYELSFKQIEQNGQLYWFSHLRQKGQKYERGDLEDLMNMFNDLYGFDWMYSGLCLSYQQIKKGKRLCQQK